MKKLGELAEAVRMRSADVRIVGIARESRRTGQRHGIGGFVGSATYEGPFNLI